MRTEQNILADLAALDLRRTRPLEDILLSGGKDHLAAARLRDIRQQAEALRRELADIRSVLPPVKGALQLKREELGLV